MSAQHGEASPVPSSTAEGSNRWLVAVLIAALATHAYVLIFFNYELSNDEKEYVALGISLAEQGELRLPTGEVAKRMPLYPALIAAIDKRQGHKLLQAGVGTIQLCLAAASTIVIAFIAHRLAGPPAGLVAGLIAAFYAPYRYLQALMLSETLVIALLLTTLLLYLYSLDTPRNRKQWSLLAVASALLGLTLLTRADGAVFAIPFAIHAACRIGSARQRALRAGILLLGVALAAIGWGYRNSRAVGTWTLSTTGGLNFYLGNNSDYANHPGMNKSDYSAFDRLRREEGLSETQADAHLYAMGRAFITDHPGEAVANLFRKMRVWLGSSITWSAPGTFLIIGWVLAVAARASPFRRGLFAVAILFSIIWMAALWQTKRPWTQPTFVVPLGLVSLFLFHDRYRIRALLAGLFAAQLLIAVVFIPLERLRWTVDGILIIALAAAVARICERLNRPEAKTRTEEWTGFTG